MNEQTVLLLAIGLLAVLNTLQLRQFKPAEGRASRSTKQVILDTCALIDGRIIEVAKGGFTPQQLIIPKAVVDELQYMADQADPMRRERARYGLDVITELQQMSGVEVQILQSVTRGDGPVDELLVVTAKKLGAQLFTTDYNLQKVATVQGVDVLNINQLAHALRPRYLPGERVTIKLVQPGQNADQAVGYLEDGTMVVVEHGKRLLRQTVTVTCSRMIQTEAGKMLFAVLDREQQDDDIRKTGKASKQSQQPAKAPIDKKPATRPRAARRSFKKTDSSY